MKYHKQRIKHDPENGKFGDCHRTVIACLLDLEPEAVPNFGEHFFDPSEFHLAVKNFLSPRGLAMVSIAFPKMELAQLLANMEAWNPNVFYLLGGRSLRGVNHSVVAYGGKLIHDPHPDNSFIVGPCDEGTENAAYWVDFIIPDILTAPSLTA